MLKLLTVNLRCPSVFGPWLLLVSLSSAAQISIPDQVANTGQLIVSPLVFSTEGAAISGIQFDLDWDPAFDTRIAVGNGIVTSGKLLYSSPLGSHGTRILIVGFNQTPLPDGELLRLFIDAGAKAGPFQIKINNPVGVSANGDPIEIRTSPATIRVGAAAGGSAILPESILNAASLRVGSIAPGEIVTFMGAFGIDPSAPEDVEVSINGLAGTVLYASGSQINLIIPLGIDPSHPAEVKVRKKDRQVAQTTVPTSLASPGLFTQSGNGIGPGAILNQDYSLNSSSNPAPAGSIVMLYGTGFGPQLPPEKDGSPGILSSTALSVSATIAGLPAEVSYSGAAPGLPTGLVQINIQIPSGIQSNSFAALRLKCGDFEIPSGVSIAVRQ